jgi:RHS repeat-associated protein
VQDGTSTTQFAYNGDGVRTSKTVSGDATQYVLDLAATLPVVVSDTEAVYLYGLDIIAQQQAERQYYFHDGLGSVRQLLDSTGEIETNYAYDPFGVPVVAGDASNPYRFTGEAWDAEVELLYLRARYYQPQVGRFITKDPWAGNVAQPSDLNHYAYVQNNPANLIDRAGLSAEPPAQPHIVSRSQWGALTPGRHETYVMGCKIVSGWGEPFFQRRDPATWEGYARYSDLYDLSGLYDERPFDLADILDTIVIHHEGNLQLYDVRAVQIQHMFGEGLADMGYHYVLDRRGVIYQGRDISVRGHHVFRGNTGRIGVLLLGDFEPGFEHQGSSFPLDWDDPGPTQAQVSSAIDLIRWLDYEYGIDYVAGHRDVDDTVCPGRRVSQELIDSFNRVAEER